MTSGVALCSSGLSFLYLHLRGVVLTSTERPEQASLLDGAVFRHRNGESGHERQECRSLSLPVTSWDG